MPLFNCGVNNDITYKIIPTIDTQKITFGHMLLGYKTHKIIPKIIGIKNIPIPLDVHQLPK